jgi:hypothetical protein
LSAAASAKAELSTGFTLIEILVTVGLLSFIIIGLLAMFQQTQTAFRAGIAQTDVLESGRFLADSLDRDLEQMKPARPPFYSGVPATNFFVEISPRFTGLSLQGLPGTSSGPTVPQLCRTNVIQDFFFLTQIGRDWWGIGYAVLPAQVGAEVGTLYRFSQRVPMLDSTNSIVAANMWFRYAASYGFAYYALTNLTVTNIINSGNVFPLGNGYGWGYVNRIADGVVHLRVRPFAANGAPVIGYNADLSTAFVPPGSTVANAYFRTNILGNASIPGPTYATVHQAAATNGYTTGAPSAPEYMSGSYFWSNAVPASVELELGVLEPRVLARYNAIGNLPLQQQYLSNHVAQVHIFRQRIPVRDVDVTAYQ